jgi:AraC-like DNA-binding protein
MKKLIFSTDDLPETLNDQARFRFWQDAYCDGIGGIETTRLPDRPFAAQLEFMPFRSALLGRFSGTVRQTTRTRQQAAVSPHDAYEFSFNTGTTPLVCVQRDHEQVLSPGEPTFQSSVEAVSIHSDAPNEWLGVMVPRQAIRALVPAADDLIHMPFDSASPALRHLRRYLGILRQLDELPDDPLLARHIETTLIDLVALVLGAGSDAAAVAKMRGLRAARVQAILAEIRTGFADPSFSAGAVAAKLGLSARYLQDLLQETGASFTERVLELRLQQALGALAAITGAASATSRSPAASTRCPISTAASVAASVRRRGNIAGMGPTDPLTWAASRAAASG